ncbi:lysine biosynthesis protein LysW [bacterium]|nr:lysine biosynthesis protein LysW [candidate division CSSED10-310 bacterium]
MEHCPECGNLIEDEGFEIGEIIECPECGVELEIISINPLEFEVFEEEEK